MMEKQLRDHLLEDEQLLWSGCPEPFDTFDKTNKTSIITGIVIKALVLLGILFLLFNGVRDNGSINPGIIIVILAFGAFAVMNPFLVARRLRKKTVYGLTNKRILRSGAIDNAVPYERIKTALLRVDEDGHTSLLCGPMAHKLKPRKWRSEAAAAFIDSSDDQEASRVILYALPMDRKLRDLLNEYLPLG